MLVIAPMSWHGLGVHCPFGGRLDEEANDQETPANGADAEAKGGKPEPEEREAGGLVSMCVEARSLTTLLGSAQPRVKLRP